MSLRELQDGRFTEAFCTRKPSSYNQESVLGEAIMKQANAAAEEVLEQERHGTEGRNRMYKHFTSYISMWYLPYFNKHSFNRIGQICILLLKHFPPKLW